MALTDNITAYWKFDENSGTNAGDATGNSNTLEFDNGIWTTGKINSSIAGDGASTYSFNTAVTTLNIGNSWTVAGWCYFDDLLAQEITFRFRANSGDGNEIRLGKSSGSKAAALAIHSSGSGTGYKDYEGNTSLSEDTWYHIAATWDGSSLKIYLNGAEDTPYTKNTDGSLSMTETERNLGIIGWNATSFVNGRADEFGVWSRALSGAEIAELYNSGTGLQYPFGVTTKKNLTLLGVS